VEQRRDILPLFCAWEALRAYGLADEWKEMEKQKLLVETRAKKEGQKVL
jgi:hypothetical protein